MNHKSVTPMRRCPNFTMQVPPHLEVLTQQFGLACRVGAQKLFLSVTPHSEARFAACLDVLIGKLMQCME